MPDLFADLAALMLGTARSIQPLIPAQLSPAPTPSEPQPDLLSFGRDGDLWQTARSDVSRVTPPSKTSTTAFTRAVPPASMLSPQIELGAQVQPERAVAATNHVGQTSTIGLPPETPNLTYAETHAPSGPVQPARVASSPIDAIVASAATAARVQPERAVAAINRSGQTSTIGLPPETTRASYAETHIQGEPVQLAQIASPPLDAIVASAATAARVQPERAVAATNRSGQTSTIGLPPEMSHLSYAETHIPTGQVQPAQIDSAVAPARMASSALLNWRHADHTLIKPRLAPDVTVQAKFDQHDRPLPMAAPTIRVSIGRVEVRVSHAAPLALTRTQPPRPQPRLSLGDYLERRRGTR